MRRAVFVVVAALVCCPMGSFGQGVPSTPITLTDKITHLEGVWVLDPTTGVRGSCATKDQADQTFESAFLTEQHRLQLPGSACLPPTEIASVGGKSK